MEFWEMFKNSFEKSWFMLTKDKYGPERIVEVYDSNTGMEGVLVVDNTARGPGKGGIRFVRDITKEEVAGLARAMTWKNALAELPFGGAKAGIKAKEGIDKKKAIKAFARLLKPYLGTVYIAGPDMYMGEKEMAIVAYEAGFNAVTGKPSTLGGLPHELGSTGFGVAKAIEEMIKVLGLDKNLSVAIEGFGNVGTFTMKFLTEMGLNVVAVSDSKGFVYNSKGLDYNELMKVKKEKGRVDAYANAEKKGMPKELFELEVDILIPGARPHVINEGNVDKIKAKYIVEAANIPATEEIEDKLAKKGTYILPDFLVNAGGVISSYAELLHYTPEKMFELVEYKIRRNTRKVLELGLEKGERNMRKPALTIAKQRVEEAMSYMV